jgi:hypothetical protein
MYELTRIHIGRQLTPLARRAQYHKDYWPNMDSETEDKVLDFILAADDFCTNVRTCLTDGFAIRDGEGDDEVVLMDLAELEQALTKDIRKLEAIGLFPYATIVMRPIRTIDSYEFAETRILHVRHAQEEHIRVPAHAGVRRRP